MKQNTENKKATIKETIQLSLRGYKIWWDNYPQMLISSGAHAITSALTPYVGIYISAQLINEIAGGRDRAVLTTLVLAALISAAALAMLNAGLLRWKNSHFAAGPWHKLRKIYADKLLSMDFRDVDSAATHDLHSQIKQNANWGGWGLPVLIFGFENLVKSVLTIAGAIFLTVSLFTLKVPESAGDIAIVNNPIFTAGVIALLLAVTFLSPVLLNKSDSYWARIGDEAKFSNRLFSFFSFAFFEHSRALDVRMYRQDILCHHYMKGDIGFGPNSVIAGYARGPMGGYAALSAVVSHVLTALVYIFVCMKAWGGAFGVGSVTQYVGAITALSKGVSDLINFFGDLRNNIPFLRTTFEFLDIPNSMYQGSLTTEKRSDNKYSIEFRNVSFKYPASDNYALRNISLKFDIGQRLAVVGQNGSGKTTFIKLLCRLYDPTEGEILLNGIDIRKYDYRQYMAIFSVVFQDFKLLSYSLGQNVAASGGYDAGKVEDCLEKAGFGERLQSMPNGLETCLYKDFDENGVEISGGEAQKIALARALYSNAPFIILDEPTAALDPIAEFEVYSAMDEIVGDKTAVFISHRLSSCRFCNDIAVFHEGALIQRGGHETLVADTGGKYYELWNAQAQYYTEGFN